MRRTARIVGRLAVGAALAGGCAAPHHPRLEAPVPAPPVQAQPSSPSRLLDFEATAYALDGRTAAGTRVRRGVVAADPAVLPLGSRIRVHDAGAYSGEYLVEDTGRTIDGHEIDIYMRSRAEARRFGRRRVKVEVLRRGSESPTADRR